MNAAVKPLERRVEVVAGLDAEQVEGAWLLHLEWAHERGMSLDARGWAEQMYAAAESGRFMLWVAWDDGVPVGVAECHLVYDPMTRQTAAFGERAYVTRAYRQRGVFESIAESIMAFADGMGCKTQRMSAEVDLRGRAMQKFYSRYGFKQVSVLMGKDG